MGEKEKKWPGGNRRPIDLQGPQYDLGCIDDMRPIYGKGGREGGEEAGWKKGKNEEGGRRRRRRKLNRLNIQAVCASVCQQESSWGKCARNLH